MNFERLDHVAIEVADVDAVVSMLEACSMQVVRRGQRFSTGQPIVMMGDGTGVKVELIEAGVEAPVVAHLAFRVDDLEATVEQLIGLGWTSVRPVHELASARARTALLAQGDMSVQLITYEPDSPDLAEWRCPAIHQDDSEKQ